jgi:two-component system CheB/CheR fusion protein
VAIGASAGGLEALELFLQNMPRDSGVAVVVVQHLDPTHKGIMPELLQRRTTLKVVAVADRTPVRPDHVYVIPSNKDMSILRGVLHLLEPSAPRGQRLPIDFFFRSLALDQQEFSVGVILSGMGTDGTLGLHAIKEHDGVAFVQDPSTAKFDAMPRSAIAAGLADIVAAPAELPVKILDYLEHKPSLVSARGPEDAVSESQLEKIVILLRSHTGHDFSLYKRNTLYRRIERRMGLHQLPKISDYVRFLRENPAEIELLFKELLIGVTSFFRDPDVWDYLRDHALPSLLSDPANPRVLRAWTPGCSTGEEAYSLAIIFKEAVERLDPSGNFSLQIFATDLDADAIEKARRGSFPASIASDIPADRLKRFFVKEEGGYRVAKEIREMVVFATQNVVMDPPFTKLDLVVCRNLLIYLEPELQKKLLPLFHYSLNPGGVLLLGSAESIGHFGSLFTPLHAKHRLFMRKPSSRRPDLVEFPSSFVAAPHALPKAAGLRTLPPDSLQPLAEQWILRHHAPPAVLVNEEGDILFVSGRTGRFLEPAAGKANWNVFAMAREELRYELGNTFQKARRKKKATCHRLALGTDGARAFVDITVQFLAEPAALSGLAMVVFHDSPALAGEEKKSAARTTEPTPRLRALQQELRQAREEALRTREEMQTSQEELKSMNEELQSMNEELQSTNEELTTSKEEMQSLNEELQTVNAELQANVDELTATSSDMRNLLNSTEIATIFLDSSLRVRRFTDQATRIINFIPGDVGRPVTDLTSDLLYPEMADDAREVLRTLVSIEKPVATRDGRWFAMRLMPYRTHDDRIDGVVITFIDLGLVRKIDAELRARRKHQIRSEKT